MYRDGQAWSIDYTISLLLFILLLPIAVNVLTNEFQSDEFTTLRGEARTVSNHLLSTGDPEYWRTDDVNRIGITNGAGRINPVRLANYDNLTYNETRTLFGTRHDHLVYFTNGTIRSVGTECALGDPSVGETKSLSQKILPIAYYHTGSSILSSTMNSYDADVYTSQAAFFNNLSRYRLLALEDPELAGTDTYTEAELRNKLANYVREGGRVLLTGNVSLNNSRVGFATVDEHDGAVTGNEDDHFQLSTGHNFSDDDTSDTSYTVRDLDAENFTPLASYNNSEAWFARWRHGLGQAYYLATLDSTYTNGGSVATEEKVDEALQSMVNVTKASCTDIDYDTIETDTMARSERLVIRNGTPLRMVVLAWE